MLGKLYLKISLSFLGVLFITLMVVFALFIISPGRKFITRMEKATQEKVLIVQQIVEEKIRSSHATDIRDNAALKEFINAFGSILGAKVWYREPDGTIALKSFPGNVAPLIKKQENWRVNMA